MPLTIKTSTLKYKDPDSNEYVAIDAVTGTEDVTDVEINGSSIVNNGVAEIPIAGTNTLGVMKVNASGANGAYVTPDGELRLLGAGDNAIRWGTSNNMPITCANQHRATFFGLAKAAGDTSQTSDGTFGTYTDIAKGKIQTMLGTSQMVADIESDNSSDQAYAIGDVFIFNGKLYKADALIAIGETITPGTNCHETTIKNEIHSNFNVKTGNTMPTTETEADYVGQLYYNTASTMAQGNNSGPSFYICTSINNGSYTWKRLYHNIGSTEYLINIGGNPTAGYSRGVVIGNNAGGNNGYTFGGIAIGDNTECRGNYTIALGWLSKATAENAIQIGSGTNDTANTFKVCGYRLLEADGTIPPDRLPIATSTTVGGVKVDTSYGMSMSNGYIWTVGANPSTIKAGESYRNPIMPQGQHISTFYGLAKAAGDTTQALSENEIGTYTSEAKTAIKTMLGVTDPQVTDVQVNGTSVVTDGVANIPIAGDSKLGTIKTTEWFYINASTGQLQIRAPETSQIKTANVNRAVTLPRQHDAVFYGLAKAAGDTTQASSSNAVGNYTESAKSAISQMLNGAVSVSGSTPSITALAGVRYICGEVSTLDITLPASGCVDVVFESGSTATVLTITPPTGVTLKWANGFDPTSLDANATYEVNICDGLGVAVSWT